MSPSIIGKIVYENRSQDFLVELIHWIKKIEDQINRLKFYD